VLPGVQPEPQVRERLPAPFTIQALVTRQKPRNGRDRKPPSDDDIERGLRERAVSDPRAAEILLRWLQRPRTDERVHGVGLDTMSEAQLEALDAGLVRVAALPSKELQALIQSLLADTEGAA
jgi:hypothetical protein